MGGEAAYFCPFCDNRAGTHRAIAEHVIDVHRYCRLPGSEWNISELGRCWCGEYRAAIDYGFGALITHWAECGGVQAHVMALMMGLLPEDKQ